jgi:hypothetical protein
MSHDQFEADPEAEGFIAGDSGSGRDVAGATCVGGRGLYRYQ